MTLLIIDTSTVKPLVVFAKESEVSLCKYLPMGWQSSQYLPSVIEEGFKELNITPSHLRTVALAVGPGSFTGIRVGAAVAKGIAFAQSLSLIGLCSLSGFIPPEDGRFASVIDARIGGAYIRIQEKKGNSITPLSDPMLVSKENLDQTLSQCQWVVGPSFERLYLPNSIEVYPNANHLARLASNKLIQGEESEDLDLVYLRKTVP